MADVRTALRTLQVIEAFDGMGRTMSLSEIAAELNIPVSSCFQLVRTLVSAGYLYGVGRRQAFYPTRRLLDIMQRVASRDPLIERIAGELDKLRDLTGETAAFSILQKDRVLYLAAAESRQTLRVTIAPGSVRPAHSTASGKALLGGLDQEARRRMLRQTEMPAFTPRTITDAAELELDLAEAQIRGHYRTFGEGSEGLSGIAVPVVIDGATYALAVSGPSERIEAGETDLAEALRTVERRIACG